MAEETDRDEIYQTFNDRVNMSPKELEQWLETEESKEAGRHQEAGGESTGHQSGRRILKIKDKKKDELTDDDYEHMQKVNNYIARHTAQRPDKPDDELEAMTWTHSLKNWGHDPLK